jgi:hypothetical protein
MLYAILCYADEGAVAAWTPEEDAACMARLAVVHDGLARGGRLGPVARLLPTTAATTLRRGREELVLDGPFAETKEQLLGFYVVECETLDAALDAARDLAKANPAPGCYEVRPIGIYHSDRRVP